MSQAETLPLLCKVCLSKSGGNSFPLESNGSEDQAAVIMAFLKTDRKITKIEAVRRKESGRNKEIVSELGGISEGALTMVCSRFRAAGYQKGSSVVVIERPQGQALVFSNLRWIYLLKKTSFTMEI